MGARRAHNPKVTGSSPVPATREKPVSNDWLFAFSEALIACFQKQMEMQKESAKSAWLFLVKPHQRSILTEWSERQDIPVPATREEKSSEMVTFFVFCHSKDLENKGILLKK